MPQLVHAGCMPQLLHAERGGGGFWHAMMQFVPNSVLCIYCAAALV